MNCIFLDNLKNVYENVISKSQEIILLGDLNIDILIEDNGLQHELCGIYNLDGLIVDPTCFKKLEEPFIDHIVVRNHKRFKKSINVFCAYIDWHNIIACITKVHIPTQKSVKVIYRSYKNFNKDDFKRDKNQIPFHICTMFNDISVLAKENCHKNLNIFRVKMVSSKYVHKIMSKLNENKATGFDNVPPKVVKMCGDELPVTVTELISSAFAKNLFPDDMKKAALCPLFKKKDDMIK